jgi:TonB-linked SusC/RagA family outer membrane protein
MCFTFLSVDIGLYAQNVITAQGQILDQKNKEPMTGATVLEKGTSNGTIADLGGNYSIKVKEGATLVISSIGYITIEVAAKSGHTTIVLEEDSELLDEVVVVGYGVQKKVNLTGSVASVGSEKIANRPVMNLSTTLAGVAPGVRVTQGRGNPGDESVSIRIRGTGSFENSDPLILVDGVVADMVPLNTDDVESISILKDASAAAIYGSRAANGVILVTTKKGKRDTAPKVTFTALFAREQAITDLKFMSSTADFMELHNIAKVNTSPTSTSPDYNETTIAEWREANKNPNGLYTNLDGAQIPNWLAYPNTDWAQILFQPTYYQKYGASVSGGSKNSSYLLSLGYQNNPGTLDNTGMQRFNIRANVETKIADIITFGTQTYATKEFKEPGSTSMTYLQQAFPGINPIYQGKYGYSEDPGTTSVDNILQQVAAEGGQNEYTRLNTTWYAQIDLPLKGLVGEAKFNYNEYMREDEHYSQNQPLYSFRESFDTPKYGIGNLEQATSYRYAYNSSSYTADLLLRYNRTFGKHDIGALVGYEQYRYQSSGFNATKKGLLDWSVTDITSAATMESIGGSAESAYAMLSYFGRVNYAYDGKYLFEANFRSDSSSKFAPGHRGNFFPSFSLGWRVSEEKFFGPVKPYVNYLKLRASYGSLGNTVGGNYDWQALYKKVNNVFNESVANGLIQESIQNLSLSWEKLTTYNIGLEAAFLNQRLTTEIDVYSRKTSDILTKSIIYMTMGNISAPMSNTASMVNKGVELTLGWNDKVGDLRYGISANLTYNTNKVTNFKGNLKYELDENTTDVWGNPTWRYTNLADVSTNSDYKYRVEGHMIDEFYLRRPYQGSGTYTNGDGSVNPNGGPKDGMIRTKADLDWVKAMVAAGYDFNGNKVGSAGSTIWYGDMIMADVNGDGKYGNDDDKEFTGKSSVPKFTLGLNLTAEWKGFDLNMLWSGRFGAYHYINGRGANTSALTNVKDVLPADAWNMYYFYDSAKSNTDPDYDPAADPNASINAKYPRLLTSSGVIPANTFYLHNTSYVKLKSLQIGYTLPRKWVAPAKISNLRVFVSGENLLTLKSSDFPGVDPELGGSIIVYPIAKLFSGGVSITF